MDRADGSALARFTGLLRVLEQRVPPFSALVTERNFRENFQCLVRRSRFRIRHRRRHNRPGPPAWRRRKRGTQNQAIGRSRGGLTTKIVVLVDALGYLSRFVLLPGQRHDTVGVEPLIEGIEFEALLGDKAFDVDWLRAELDRRGATAVIPPKSNRKETIPCDFAMYAWRHLVENFFCKLKEFRRIATRYDKTDCSFTSMIYLASSMIAMR